jgi:hypothetical protein
MRKSSLSRVVLTAFLVVAGIVQAAQPGAAPTSGRPAASAVTVALDTAFTGNTDFEARGTRAGGISIHQFGARLSVPLAPVNQQWFPSIGLRYRQHRLDRDPGTPLPSDLKSLGLSLNAFGALSPEWSLFASVSPGYGNAGSGFNSRGLGVGVMALASRKFASDFSGGIGVRYDSLARGTTQVLPIATLDWTPAPGWRAFIGFPRTGASWRVNDALTADFVADMDFGTFYVTDDPLPAGLNKPALNRTRLEYQAVRVGPALTWRASPGFSTRIAAGFVPLLNAEYEQRNYKLKSDQTAGFVSLELDWKF